ncbi:MAG: hypothetical protein IPM69_00210 [Ignavibacteria bacterium]|nr:hypothetical protein [Ignavibacteria bacterium]
MLNEYLGVKYDNKYEIFLTPINSKGFPRTIKIGPIKIHIHYFGNDLLLTIESNPNETPGTYFSDNLMGYYGGTSNILLTIDNYNISTNKGEDNDLNNIVSSVLFDFEYCFNIAVEPIELNGLSRSIKKSRKLIYPKPEIEIHFTYKRYIQELIQYFHLSEKVEHIPFKYLCYFHILEYFSDKSAYLVIAKKVKDILLKPDFHQNIESYVNHTVNIFKKENEKHLSDKNKLERVLRHYIDLQDFKEYLSSIDLLEYFEKEQIFVCSKVLKVPLIDFTNDNNFYNSLASRIYIIRCSIVHSNPDFDESKAVPFVTSVENNAKLNTELALVYEVSRNIIIKSCDNK